MSVLQEAPPLVRQSREERALTYLRPALADAVRTGRPVTACYIPTSLTSLELTALAVLLCREEQVNVAVLAKPDCEGVVFTPL
jgi:hypothetical protein